MMSFFKIEFCCNKSLLKSKFVINDVISLIAGYEFFFKIKKYNILY